MKSSIFTQFSFSMMQSLRTIENHFSDENFCLIFIFSIPFQKALFSPFFPFFADYTNKINWVNPDPVKKWLLLFVCLFVCLPERMSETVKQKKFLLFLFTFSLERPLFGCWPNKFYFFSDPKKLEEMFE